MKHLLCALALIQLSLGVSHVALALPPSEIEAANTAAVVYIQIEDADGKFMGSGTGFIISHDGYVVTAGHVKPEPGQRIWAVVGQREGTRYPLEPRAMDADHDTALWQLPQSATCRQAVTLSNQPINKDAQILAMGFPGSDGLTATRLNVVNVSGAGTGYYKSDGFVRRGYSGGPIFNDEGKVIAIVASGAPAGGNNDLIPISFAIALTTPRGVRIGLNAPAPYAASCYANCRAAAHGVERWTVERSWSSKTGEMFGGYTPQGECAKLAATEMAMNPGSQIEFLPGDQGQRGETWKNIYGQGIYVFHCAGTLRSGPIYQQARSPACGLWNSP